MSIYAENIPDALPNFLAARINADPFYANIYVLVVDENEPQNDILKKLSTKIGKGGMSGVSLLILPISNMTDSNPNMYPGPMDMHIEFQVWEDRLINKDSSSGTGLTCYSVARHTYELFKGFAVGGMCKAMMPDKPAISPVPPPELNKKLRGRHIGFVAKEDTRFVQLGINQPTFTPASGASASVVINCTTAGAAIWYTTDGTPPAPNSGTSTIYAGPINLAAGSTTIMAAAFLNGNYPSSIISSTFTN